jgi:hypothetical protein
MFGTVYRVKPRPGQEMMVVNLLRQWGRERRPLAQGALHGYLFRSKDRPDELIGVAVFDTEANYYKNAEDPAQDAWYRELRGHLVADPEWNDGEVLVAF